MTLEHKNITPFIKGGTRAKLNQKELRAIEVNVPTCQKTQKKIARILQTVDEAIEKTEALIEKYSQIKAGMMQDLFTRGLTPDGKLRPPRSEAPELYRETPIGWIPKEWDFVEIQTCVRRIEQGWSPDCEADPATHDEWGMLKTTAVSWNGFNREENKKLPSDLKPRLRLQIKKGDLLVTRAGPNSRVGVVSIVDNEPGNLMLSDKIYRLDVNNEIQTDFLALALSSQSTQRYLDGFKTGLAESQTNISQRIVGKLVVAKPVAFEQQSIALRMRLIEKKLGRLETELAKLQVQKSGLMHDLLTGERPVQIDDPEPANV